MFVSFRKLNPFIRISQKVSNVLTIYKTQKSKMEKVTSGALFLV